MKKAILILAESIFGLLRRDPLRASANVRRTGKTETPADAPDRGRRMKKTILILLFAGVLLSGPMSTSGQAASWSGVDKTVIEKFAEKAGRSAREPFINTDQGDLILFVFLLAGVVGGFAAGYWFRVIFPPRRRKEDSTGSS
jgi:cobalt/nickel transport system permease protein